MSKPESKSLTVAPGPKRNTVRTGDGDILAVPQGWELLPPGDAGLTRRVKAAGPSWTVKEQQGRRTFSRGVWAPSARIERLRAGLEAERGTVAYKQKQASAKARRDRDQQAYVREFTRHVEAFLSFTDEHATLARQMATAIAEHATPVGSGTVARTTRIPVAERAEAATIAWMRHQTTAYDRMSIPRVKGRRKEVRRALAKRSRELLNRYRCAGEPWSEEACPLRKALSLNGEGVVPQAVPSSKPDPPSVVTVVTPSAVPSEFAAPAPNASPKPPRAPTRRPRPRSSTPSVQKRTAAAAATPASTLADKPAEQDERALRQAKVRERLRGRKPRT